MSDSHGGSSAALQIETCRMAEKCFGSVEIPDQVIKHIFLKPESGDKLCVGENGGSIQRVGVSPGGSVRRHWRRRIREEGWEGGIANVPESLQRE